MEDAEIRKSRGVYSTALLLNWVGRTAEEDQEEEEKTLELSLGLPGGGRRRTACREKGKHPAVDGSVDLSLGYSTLVPNSQVHTSGWLDLRVSRKGLDGLVLQLPDCFSSDNLNFFGSLMAHGKANGSPEAVTRNALAAPNNNSSQTRSPGAPVVGWPPVRASRRNLASSSRVALEQQNVKKAVKAEETKRAPFVKINMDGIPIGRKIDLNAFDSYGKLSVAVDKLFRHLLAAQRDPRTEECPREEVAISGLLDGTGEYTLVYEDYEGDRVLVGDVPWGMFVSSAKRLRVLKTSDLSSSLITSNRKRTAADC
ncbi:auxin-responsive protein IAA7-like [Lolium rigidum]|uniref:auxin-responsive protein IAA7-like n=1 Tax=Lolium rigidum TaxID=89674 RepID=UPI001F5D286E|nr:auxin-responsive protein IAA7-like [Lolium rigidum]